MRNAFIVISGSTSSRSVAVDSQAWLHNSMICAIHVEIESHSAACMVVAKTAAWAFLLKPLIEYCHSAKKVSSPSISERLKYLQWGLSLLARIE